ncbi:peptidase S8/S53 domain-containing protein [Hysterangium stoloniferum]|nr:peptidase S8/S53 domain-containing protein [Hysterangium stoloniferum]
MKLFIHLVELFALLLGSVAHETYHPSKEWVKQRPAPSDHEITLRISLAQPNFDILESHLYAVSDPDSPRYGQHLSMDAVQELTAPNPLALESLNGWLAGHGFDIHGLLRSPSSDWVKIKTTIQKAEDMLNTTYHVWKSNRTGNSLVRTTSWSLPDFLHEHVDLVHPTTMFTGGLQPRATTFPLSDKIPIITPLTDASPDVDPSCNNTITPTCLLQLYNATQYTVQAADKGNQIAISSYLNQFANLADLQEFYANLVPAAVNSSFDVVSINGGQNNQTLSRAGGEANLDTQYAFGLTFPTPATVFTTGGSPPFNPDDNTPTNSNEPYMDWVDFLLTQKHLPQTSDDEQTVPSSFARSVCAKFAILGARGVTLTVSSGDGGVGDGDPNPATSDCLTNDGKNETKFIPAFPASCPFVTSVGGTVNVPERAVDRFGSGGGFSNFFPRPAYQNAAVNGFLKANGDTNKDVAAQGDNFVIFLRGRAVSIGGTSAASPTFAGIVALLNDARMAAGKPPLGFLNPLLYSKGMHAFNDITVGNNPGCGTEGFSCRVGWDAVTGLGTPNFGLLKDIVLRN